MEPSVRSARWRPEGFEHAFQLAGHATVTAARGRTKRWIPALVAGEFIMIVEKKKSICWRKPIFSGMILIWYAVREVSTAIGP